MSDKEKAEHLLAEWRSRGDTFATLSDAMCVVTGVGQWVVEDDEPPLTVTFVVPAGPQVTVH